MTSHVRRVTLLGALAILLMLVSLVAPIGTPAQSTETETAVPTAETPVPVETAVPPVETPTSAPTEPAAPTATATEPAPTTNEPAISSATQSKTESTTDPPISVANHTATISPTRVTVNQWVNYTITNFPPNATVNIMWRRNTGSVFQFATATTDATGAASGRFRVPAVTGGPDQTIAFVSGDVAKRVTIEVRPRIKVLTQPSFCGEPAQVSLRGYAKNESVRIRWKVGDSWIHLTTVVTSNTGSANVFVIVPESASSGLNSVRGDGTIFRQQTNAAEVICD